MRIKSECKLKNNCYGKDSCACDICEHNKMFKDCYQPINNVDDYKSNLILGRVKFKMDKKQVLQEEINDLILVVGRLKKDIEKDKILEETIMVKTNTKLVKDIEAKIGKYIVMLNSIEE